MKGYEDWKSTVCQMHCIKELKDFGFLYGGHTFVSKDDLNKNIPYKYVVLQSNGHEEYEYIYCKTEEKSPINRCLYIPSQYTSKGEWHQYDDVCFKKNDGLLKKILEAVFKEYKSICEAKKKAGDIMLRNIYSVLATCDEINLSNFFQQLEQFHYVAAQSRVIADGPIQWGDQEYIKKKVPDLMRTFLNTICAPFINKNKEQEAEVKLNRIIVGIICQRIVSKFSIHVTKELLSNICCVLCLDETPKEMLIGELQAAKTLFNKFEGTDELLRQLCQQCIDENVEDWVWILPVLHMFSHVSRTANQEDVWAGLEGIAYDKLKIQESAKDVLGKMNTKKYLLQSHPMVVRSWLCLIPLDQMVTFLDEPSIPIEDILKACYYKFADGEDYQKEKAEEVLRKILQLIRKQGKSLKVEESFQNCCKAGLDLHRSILSHKLLKSCFEMAALSAQIILTLLSYAGLSNGNDENESLQPEIKEVFDNTMAQTIKWLKDVYGDKFTRKFSSEIQAWNLILKAGENATQKWRDSLLSVLCRKIKQEEPINQIMIYCKEQNLLKDLHPSISKCFEDCAVEATRFACKSENNILHKLDTNNLENFERLVSSVILHCWPKDEHGKCVMDTGKVLEHLLQWDDAIYIFKLYGIDSRIIQHRETQGLVDLSKSVFQEAIKSIIDGTVLIKHLESILNSKKMFLEICKLKEGTRGNVVMYITEVMAWREKELKILKEEYAWMGSLLQMIQKTNLKVNVSEVQRKYSQKLGPQKLNDLMSVKIHGKNIQGISTYAPSCSTDVMDMAYHVHIYRNSHVFITCWKEQQENYFADSFEYSDSILNRNKEDCTITLEVLRDQVFTPCITQCKTFYKDLKTVKITFEIVDKFLKDFKNKYKQLKDEFRILLHLGCNDGGEWIAQRVQQVEQYHQLDVAFNSAKVIDRDERTEVKTLLKLSGNFQILTTLLEFADNFENCKQKPLSCINEEVMKTRKLLSEIKDEHIECLKEVLLRKDFFLWVKEALKNVNELKVFVDLASISAGENDMDVDRVACFHDAVLGYSSLLYELDSHSGFDKLMTCLQKLWRALKNDPNLPKKLRDSARQIQWLKTVKESHGSVELSSLSLVTTINKRGMYIIQAPKDNKKITPDNVIQLNLQQEGDSNIHERGYTLEELKELLNKLMLMSAKGDQSNEEVDKFSEIFSNVQRLSSSFIDLYLAGNMLFRTWKAEIYCSDNEPISICMTFDVNGIDKLEGQGPLTNLLPDICKTMENLLEEWTKFMTKKRTQHYYLNYYTAEQLVFLCQQLQRRDISEEALVMLSFIKPECQKIDTRNSCCTNTGSTGSFTQGLKFADCSSALRKVWEYSMACMNSLFLGCLDLDTLGPCLASLAKQNNKWVSRKFHPSLHEGRPNLILCHSPQILSCALAIYMHSFTEPLPSYDEVLLCTPQTSFEEVALFFRRCLTLGYNGKKIYSLIYADELNYDTAYRAEQLFQQLHTRSNGDYYLVIICNSDREHCYIPSVFSQHKVHVIPHTPLDELQRYLRTHFAVNPAAVSAAHVFQDGLSAGIVSSERAGVGKSLYVKRLYKKLRSHFKTSRPVLKTIRLINPEVDESKVLNTLLPFLEGKRKDCPVIFHIDVTSSVKKGISEFLFKLFVLQYLMDSEGRIWKRLPSHLYIVEILESASTVFPRQITPAPQVVQHNFIDFFPKISCYSPKEVLRKYTEDVADDCGDPGMDIREFRSEWFQRPYQYLTRFYRGQNLDQFEYIIGSVEGDPAKCLQIFLFYCGIIDPSWSELRNFAWFLNLQLRDCESSVFCDFKLIGDTLPGFKNCVVKFMILMAKDFATPSLEIADQSPGRQATNFDGLMERDLAPFLLRKKWESEPHPYIFFNNDHVSMTFIGFHLQPNNAGGVDAINPRNNTIIERNVMTPQLYEGLRHQRVPFNIDFDRLPREEKISRLCLVLGIEWPFDPDETYELTTDNILKILAIKMRFRCGIPVVIMGETGCGKTRLIKFLCHLCKGFVDTENMKLVKVHGGTTAEMIYQKILDAQDIACFNKQNGCDTVLFFDEANTTEAISSIKEALCDHTVDGQPLEEESGLHIIAACNPYRKHTDEMIRRLESAGLGYRVIADETKERLGSIPLRQLVYRVHALPPSMMPLVWDFGQLNNETEKKYIQQIVQRLAKEIQLSAHDMQLVTDVLSASQTYMRRKNDECSFVSLRDVERCIEVFKWFYNHHAKLLKNQKSMLEDEGRISSPKDKVAWSLVLAAGVCYHASLETKESYRETICKHFPHPYRDKAAILRDISVIQDLFLSGVNLRDTIAKNLALKENLFMMVICIELKIPLFLVGKPGSSKSLAKTIVADAMQGQAAHTELYRDLKQIHLVSFQCSPHSTPEGIIGTFKHCARFQEGKNLREYVSVVVLDEIGLAEDSVKMPLKTLHPLLEDGCIDDDPLPHKKVGFIGISNWALDPAKMNRGIFVSRGDPSKKELIESANGICSSDTINLEKVSGYFQYFADAYQRVCETQKEQKKEFFGLRDFYSLIKMVFAFTKESDGNLTEHKIARAVLRNFSGKDDLNALEIFVVDDYKNLGEVNTIDLVMENITNDGEDWESRYLLILTKNYAALQILQQALIKENQKPEIIFGSSFPKDQKYTQICRNINRVKNCMETGQMVILLNLQNLYESLYDALNQYYVYLAGQKYVDLGLGTHRVKCRVHPKFRLIVIEEKDIVYKDFPIPLINRLEKHYLDISTFLKKEHKGIVQELEAWVQDFTKVKVEHLMVKSHDYSPSDVFVGYHSDTCASVVLHVLENMDQTQPDPEDIKNVKKKAKIVLLKCATPDSVIRYKSRELIDEYFKIQHHGSLLDFLSSHITSSYGNHTIFTEVTTFSHLLTSADKKILDAELHNSISKIEILSLQQFETEFSFLKKIRSFLESSSGNLILIIQTDFEEGSQGANLVASAKYSAVNEINKLNFHGNYVFVYFITKLPRIKGGTSYVGFRGGLWQSVHIDDLRKSKDMVTNLTGLLKFTISQLFSAATDAKESAENNENENHLVTAMEVDQIEDITNMEIDQEVNINMEIVAEIDEHHETETNMTTDNTEKVLDTTTLIRSCVQNAIGLLRDEGISTAATRRVEILIQLLSSESELNGSFLKQLKFRLHNMLKAQEELFQAGNWVVREATNLDALQEAGTFRQTLWKRVQKAVTPFLSQILSIIDCNGNLEFLVKNNVEESLKSLWMFIFSNEELLPVSSNFSFKVLDIFAAIACMEILKDSVKHLRPEDWMYQVKNIQMPIELICSEEYLNGYSSRCKPGIDQIRSDWNSVFSMALFMEHMLVDDYLQDANMRRIIIGTARCLGQCLENFRDIKSHKPFMVVVKVLQKCRDEVSRSVSRFGMQNCGICQKEPKEPVCLPCDHIFCRVCLSEWLKPGKKNCPYCKTQLPDNVTIVVSDEVRESMQKNDQFRRRCNGFFVDVVCTMCFKDRTPPDKEVIDHLMSLLFADKGLEHYTRSLSLFEDAVDQTPVLRSILLKLLLKYSFTDIMGYAQDYFSKVERNNLLTVLDTTEVYVLFVNCLEDSLFEKGQRIQSDPSHKEKYLKDEGSFLEQYIRGEKKSDTTVQFLQDVAKVRLALNTAAELLSVKSKGATNENYLQCVKKLCSMSGNDWYRVYLIRKLANMDGIDTVQRHFKDAKFVWLFPRAMLQNKESQTNEIDQFLVCGDSYKAIRDGIGKAMIEGKEEWIQKALQECKNPNNEFAVHVILAVFREISLYYGIRNNPEHETVAEHEAIKNCIKNINILQERATKHFVETLLSNNRPVLRVVPQIRSSRIPVFGLAIHMAAVLLNGNNHLFSPLRNLSFFPSRMQNSYLPTMPEDLVTYARAAMREQIQWYSCPKGHYCAVGECGQPMQTSRCLECGATVGGENHRAHAGFQRMEHNEDRTQTGHVLGAPERQGAVIAPDRDLPAPAFIILRMVTHLSMLLGSEEDLQNVVRIVKPPVPDVRSFLFHHIDRDLENLRNTLGKSADDTTTIVHLVLCQMLNPDQRGQWPVHFDAVWSRREMRNTWEKDFASAVIAPVLKNLDKDLKTVNNYISKDERISSNPIVRIVYGDPLNSGEKLQLPRHNHVHCSKIWSCRERISIEYVMHIIQQKDEKDALPLLWKFLEKEAELKMVKFLPGILSLQKELVKRFQNCRELVRGTISDFLCSIPTAGARDLMKKRIEEFLLTWNNLRLTLQTDGEIKLPSDMCNNALTMDSKFSYLLPRRQGDGLCATALVSYLITLHNSFIYAVEKYTKNEQKYFIRPSEVTNLHVINYEMEKDFIPIVLSNCQYTLESGKETLQDLDLPKIQQQITSRVFQGKPLITMVGLPTILSTQDRNYENLFSDIRKKLQQIPLPNSAIDFISKDLNTFSDVCEAMNIVDVMLGFLSMSGGDPELPITKYIEDVLQMKDQSSDHVLEALKRCYLKNTIALWQLLSTLKSAHLLHLKRDPFVDVDQAYKTQLEKEGRQQLIVFLEQNGTNVFLLELHEMITIKLKKPHSTNDFRPSWTLRDVLGPLLDDKNVSFPEMETDFPEQITLAHCIDTWKVAASKKWDRL
ncbi:LOW QUALITY PROTEIN: E3 ubiquitin-protein ligase RNF213-like [Leptodactylus fuscus]|uniref:LOW QUALITY PROTEIN: E3 ubiquitin-protein ligase RNF213-like n=1 Tax=Leptodactylus fuscus TaxID=238119 RepID=UPI003F4EC877